jgi:membrane protein
VRILDRTAAAYDRRVDRLRQRSQIFRNLWAAKERFIEVLGGRLAAAISYYGFFAAFALVVVAYSIFGRAASQELVVDSVDGYVDEALPWLVDTAEQVSHGEVRVIGSIALVLAGVGWVEALRSSQRAVWRLPEHPGNWVVRRLIDLGMLAGLGLLLALSLAMAAVLDGALAWLAPDTNAGRTLIRSSGPVLELFVNIMLAAAMLAAVPRLRIPARRLIPPAVFVALGIQLLNAAGRWLIGWSASRPAYSLVAGAAGLLVYLYLLNQLILFGAALAATAAGEPVRDLAAAPPRRDDQGVGPPADPHEPVPGVGEPHGRGLPLPR